jgi:TPR repeat protein
MWPKLLLLVALSAMPGVASANPVDDATAAARAGDFATALRVLIPSAEANDPQAAFVLAMLYEAGHGVPKDTAKAAVLYAQAAKRGIAPAQNNLGSLYANGDGVPRDAEQAVNWWWRAADQGLSIAQINLAAYYALGTAVTQDLIQAYKWAAIAAAGGDREALDIVEIVAPLMSEDQIGRARILVGAWRAVEDDGRIQPRL